PVASNSIPSTISVAGSELARNPSAPEASESSTARGSVMNEYTATARTPGCVASSASLDCQLSGAANVSNSATSTATSGGACSWVSTTRTRSEYGDSSARTPATTTSKSLITDTRTAMWQR